jgi:hypothetical protein
MPTARTVAFAANADEAIVALLNILIRVACRWRIEAGPER